MPQTHSLMRLSDFILNDKIYGPISTLHRLNIEPDSISYIERRGTSNQPSLASQVNSPETTQCRRRAATGGEWSKDIFGCIVSWPDMNETSPWWERGRALLLITLCTASFRKLLDLPSNHSYECVTLLSLWGCPLLGEDMTFGPGFRLVT